MGYLDAVIYRFCTILRQMETKLVPIWSNPNTRLSVTAPLSRGRQERQCVSCTSAGWPSGGLWARGGRPPSRSYTFLPALSAIFSTSRTLGRTRTEAKKQRKKQNKQLTPVTLSWGTSGDRKWMDEWKYTRTSKECCLWVGQRGEPLQQSSRGAASQGCARSCSSIRMRWQVRPSFYIFFGLKYFRGVGARCRGCFLDFFFFTIIKEQ